MDMYNVDDRLLESIYRGLYRALNEYGFDEDMDDEDIEIDIKKVDTNQIVDNRSKINNAVMQAIDTDMFYALSLNLNVSPEYIKKYTDLKQDREPNIDGDNILSATYLEDTQMKRMDYASFSNMFIKNKWGTIKRNEDILSQLHTYGIDLVYGQILLKCVDLKNALALHISPDTGLLAELNKTYVRIYQTRSVTYVDQTTEAHKKEYDILTKHLKKVAGNIVAEEVVYAQTTEGIGFLKMAINTFDIKGKLPYARVLSTFESIDIQKLEEMIGSRNLKILPLVNKYMYFQKNISKKDVIFITCEDTDNNVAYIFEFIV